MFSQKVFLSNPKHSRDDPGSTDRDIVVMELLSENSCGLQDTHIETECSQRLAGSSLMDLKNDRLLRSVTKENQDLKIKVRTLKKSLSKFSGLKTELSEKDKLIKTLQTSIFSMKNQSKALQRSMGGETVLYS